jgi:phospholipid-binding lipoprotein MlaA
MSHAARFLQQGLCVLALAALTACAATTPETDGTPVERHFTDAAHEQYAEEQFAVYDPFEGTNKYIYKFNAEADEYVLIPIVDAYTYVTPEFLRHRVSDFFHNVGEVTNFTNAVLQVSPEKAATTLGRFAVNTTVGLLGTFDVATDMGLNRQPEDFGQTLGYWGADAGPYIVLPLLGPSNLRDTVGQVADWATLSFVVPNHVEYTTAYEIAAYGVQPLDMRYENKFRYFESGTPFEYELVRYITTHSRELEIEK